MKDKVYILSNGNQEIVSPEDEASFQKELKELGLTATEIDPNSGNQKSSTGSATVEQNSNAQKTNQSKNNQQENTESNLADGSSDSPVDPPSYKVSDANNPDVTKEFTKEEFKNLMKDPQFIGDVKAGRVSPNVTDDPETIIELQQQIATLNEAYDEEGMFIPYQTNEFGKRTYINPETQTWEEEVKYDYDRSKGVRFKKDSKGKMVDNFTSNIIKPFVKLTNEAIESGQDADYTSEMFDLLRQGGSDQMTSEEAQLILQLMYEQSQQGASENIENWAKDMDEADNAVWGFISATIKNPAAAYEAVLTSVSGQVAALSDPSIAVGAVASGGLTARYGSVAGGAGMAAGFLRGVMSYAGGMVEATSKIGELIKEEFKDAENPNGRIPTEEEFIRLYNNKQKWNKIKNKAITKGVAIGLIDNVGGFGTTKLTSKVASTTGKAPSVLTGVASEMTVGASGEVISNKLIGEETKRSEWGLEALGGLGSGSIDIAAGVLSAATYKINGSPASFRQVQEFLETATAEQLATTDIDIKNNPDLKAVYEQKRKNAIDEVNIAPTVIDVNDRKRLVELGNELDQAIKDSKKTGAWINPTAKPRIEKAQKEIDQIHEQYTGIDGRNKAVQREKARTKAIMEKVSAMRIKERVRFTENFARIYGMEVEKGEAMSQEEVDNYIKENNSDGRLNDASDAAGFVDWKNKKIILNANEIAKQQNWNVASHELLHVVLKTAMDKGQITMKTIEGLKAIIGENVWNTIIEKRKNALDENGNRLYTDAYMENNLDEYFTFISDAMQDGDIKYNMTIAEKLKSTLESIIGGYLSDKIGIRKQLTFDTPKGAFDFLKTYSRSIKSGKIDDAIVRLTGGDVSNVGNTKLSKIDTDLDASTAAIDQHLENVNSKEDFNKKPNPRESSPRDKVLMELYVNNALDGIIYNKIIGNPKFGAVTNSETSIQEIVEDVKQRLIFKMDAQFKPVLDGNKRSLFSWFYGNKQGKGGAIDFVILDVQKQYIKDKVNTGPSMDNTTADGTTFDFEDDTDQTTDIDERNILEENIAEQKGLDPLEEKKDGKIVADEFGFDEETNNTINDRIEETDYDVNKNYEDVKGDIIDQENPDVKSKNDVEPTGTLYPVIEAISNFFGVDPKAILARPQNLTSPETKNARTKIAEIMEKLGPKEALKLILPNTQFNPKTGKSIGLGKRGGLLGSFYIDGGLRVPNIKGKVLNVDNMTNAEILAAFGINPDFTLMPQNRAGDFDSNVKGFIIQTSVLSANQNARITKGEPAAPISIGKPEVVFSKQSIEKSQDIIDNKNFDIGIKGIKNLLRKYGIDDIYNLKNEEQIDAFIEAIKSDLIPLMPKGFWFGPRGGSTFKSSSKILGPGMSQDPLWTYYKSKIDDIFNDENQKYGDPVDGVVDYTVSSYKTLFKDEATIKKNIKNGKIDAFNDKVSAIHKEFWKRFNEAIQNDKSKNKNKAKVIANYLKVVGSDTKHWHKLGAQFDGYNKNPKMKYEYEHAMPATQAYMYLMDVALGKGNFDQAYNEVIDNYKLIALDKFNDNKITKAGLRSKMPQGWNLIDNLWWERYFNEEVSRIDGGIYPESIIGLDGKSLAETLGIKSDGNPTVIKPSKKDIKTNQNIIKANTKTSKKPRGMSTFDFDETLIIDGENFIVATNPETNEQIKIKSGDWPIKGPQLAEQGYTFDFDDFVNVRGGVDGPLLQKMKNQIEKYGPDNVFILTARPQSADIAIHEWLKSKGINIPFKNITGLADSRGQAKADWMLEKFAEGYNDMYFVDDALPNVEAVKNVLDQLDIKSKVDQVKTSKMPIYKQGDMSSEFNEMLERSTGVNKDKVFSTAEARIRGKNKRRWSDIFVPPSAEDFKGLMYRFYGKGKRGEKDMQWIKDNLLTPYSKAYKTWNSYKQRMSTDYSNLKKKYKDVVRSLNTKVEGTNFTVDQAIRVYLWNKNGIDIPGLAETTKQKLIKHVKSNQNLINFSNGLQSISKAPDGYIKPKDYWVAETIANDLNNLVNTHGREIAFAEWIANKNEIFSKENLNKIEATEGSSYRAELEKILHRMETGRNRTIGKDSQVNAWLNWINGSVGAVMFFNMRSAGLQTMSMVNFINWSDNNIFKSAKAFANQPQFWSDFSTIFNSDMLKQRRAGLEIDVSASELTAKFKESNGKPQAIIAYLLEKGFTPTRIADSFAIAMGGAGFYRNRIETYVKQGMSQKEAENQAFLDFQEIAEETQQSSRPDLISNQQAGALGRLVLAWQNTPMQYTRLTKKAMSDLVNNRGDKKTNVSKMIYYGTAQNIMFSALQTGLAFTLFGAEFDDEEMMQKEKRVANGALDSFLRGTGIYGSAAATLKNTLIQWDYERNQPYGKRQDWRIMREAISLSPPMGSKYRKIMYAIKTEQYNQGVSEEIGLRLENPNLSIVANMTEGLTNIPTGRLLNKANNLEEAINGNHQLWQRVALVGGWNMWDLGLEDKTLQEAKERAKQKRADEKKKLKKEEKLKKEQEEKKRKEKEGIKTVKCSGTRSDGQPCKLTTETKADTWLCPHHAEFKDGSDRDGDGIKEYQCTAITSSGKRCKNKTENKNKKCYAHQ